MAAVGRFGAARACECCETRRCSTCRVVIALKTVISEPEKPSIDEPRSEQQGSWALGARATPSDWAIGYQAVSGAALPADFFLVSG